MDRELTNKEKWQDRRKIILRWSLGGAVAVVAVVLLAVLIQPSVRESSLRLATVDTGSIERRASRCCVWNFPRCRLSMTTCWTRSG